MADAPKGKTQTFAWKDAPEVDELPSGGRGRTGSDNEFIPRLQAALDGRRPDPKHPGYFLGRGVFASDEEKAKEASRIIHAAAAQLKASAMVRTGRPTEDGIPVYFSVNPTRKTRK